MYSLSFFLFFSNATATTQIYTLSLHDALPISDAAHQALRREVCRILRPRKNRRFLSLIYRTGGGRRRSRSEEHTSELQSRQYLVCRLLLEKKKKYNIESSRHVIHEHISHIGIA